MALRGVAAVDTAGTSVAVKAVSAANWEDTEDILVARCPCSRAENSIIFAKCHTDIRKFVALYE